MKNPNNTSMRSFTPRTKGEFSTNKKLQAGSRRKPSRVSYRETDEDNQLNAKRISTEFSRRRKSKVNRGLVTTQTVQRVTTPPLGTQVKLGQRRKNNSNSSSISSDQQLVGTTASPVKSNRVKNHGSVTWAASPPKPHVPRDRRRRREEDVKMSLANLLGSIMLEPCHADETAPKPDSALHRRSENRTPPLTPKQPPDESSIKPQKKNDEDYDYIKGLKKISDVDMSREPSLEATLSRESVRKKRKTGSGKASTRKRSGSMKGNSGSRRTNFYLKPLTSTATVSSDQEEVISKWRKRLETSSPPPQAFKVIASPIASSSLRDSHIYRAQSTPGNESLEDSIAVSYLIPNKDSPGSLEYLEYQKLLRPMTEKRSNEVLSPNEEIVVRIELEKTRRQIQYLEALARDKLDRLEAIRWKKKRALEEEVVLNDKLEKLLCKIQELKESDSFARLFDKQTQVFMTKRTRPNIK
ncbi:uncharacterized protein [Halyomorpha halys]|uniref:uncharacterized protein isoform X2 n=1 Tax=Halyomorpha halys TaxID=286706 RepID=UPI0006D4EADC|nr:uncharacterized protein LOC106682150 isoform X2 [Halyomorpha halys]